VQCPKCGGSAYGWVSDVIYEFATEGAGERLDGHWKCVNCGFVEYPKPPKSEQVGGATAIPTFRNGGIPLSDYDFGGSEVIVKREGEKEGS